MRGGLEASSINICFTDLSPLMFIFKMATSLSLGMGEGMSSLLALPKESLGHVVFESVWSDSQRQTVSSKTLNLEWNEWSELWNGMWYY